jgi:protein-tyrosine kinase
MSIIEKAVSALGKGSSSKKDAYSDSESNGESAVNTVERAQSRTSTERQVSSKGAPGQSTVAAPESEQHAGFPDVVNIPFMELREKGMLTPSIPRSAIAEEYRTIKRPLLTNIAGDHVTPPIPHGNLIMVTSALEGDGKTFSSISLALSIAMEQDKIVLFIDADTAKAEAGRMLGVPANSPGLIELLEDKNAKPDDFILSTNVEKLRILPAGGVHAHANELLASDRMKKLMMELSEEHPDRVIVFDSPPLLLTTEAAVLAGFMGQIVIVVSAELTPQNAVIQAIEHIGQDKMVGLVLNRSRSRSNPYHQTYGAAPYGYGSRERLAAGELGQ